MHPLCDLETKALWAQVTRLQGLVTALQEQVTTLTATVVSLQWAGPPRVPPTPPPGLDPSYRADLGPSWPPHCHCSHSYQVPSHTPNMVPSGQASAGPPTSSHGCLP